MNIYLDTMKKIGADGVDFVPIGTTMFDPSSINVIESISRETFEVYPDTPTPKTATIFWKLVNGRKEYIPVTNLENVDDDYTSSRKTRYQEFMGMTLDELASWAIFEVPWSAIDTIVCSALDRTVHANREDCTEHNKKYLMGYN